MLWCGVLCCGVIDHHKPSDAIVSEEYRWEGNKVELGALALLGVRVISAPRCDSV